MSIKDRLSKKTADLIAPTKQDQATGNGGSPLRTGPGQMLMVNSLMRESNEKLAQLEARLKEYDGSLPAKLIDSKLVLPSKWANRIEDSFSSQDFEQLKQEIQEAGGNVQPIKVRPLPDTKEKYEIIFGHRRHRACLELGLPVFALVEQVGDQDLFKQMDRENRTRQDLSPWEQGRMYYRALSEKLFSSQDQLARELGVDAGNLSKALRLATIDESIIEAFNSPLELQYRFAKPLCDALKSDPEGMRHRAAKLAKLRSETPLSAKDIFNVLIGTRSLDSSGDDSFEALDVVIKSSKKGTSVLIKQSQLSNDQIFKLKAFLKELLAK